jgi:MerR family regulatory protein
MTTSRICRQGSARSARERAAFRPWLGEFSRLVGVTPSALRYYDDCGLLVPAHTFAATGYRFYVPDQRDRATVIRWTLPGRDPLGRPRQLHHAGHAAHMPNPSVRRRGWAVLGHGVSLV